MHGLPDVSRRHPGTCRMHSSNCLSATCSAHVVDKTRSRYPFLLHWLRYLWKGPRGNIGVTRAIISWCHCSLQQQYKFAASRLAGDNLASEVSEVHRHAHDAYIYVYMYGHPLLTVITCSSAILRPSPAQAELNTARSVSPRDCCACPASFECLPWVVPHAAL